MKKWAVRITGDVSAVNGCLYLAGFLPKKDDVWSFVPKQLLPFISYTHGAVCCVLGTAFPTCATLPPSSAELAFL